MVKALPSPCTEGLETKGCSFCDTPWIKRLLALHQHWRRANVSFYLGSDFSGKKGVKRHLHGNSAFLANTGQPPNAVSMTGQRRRRWANIETVLGEWQMFAGVLLLSIQQTQCWSSVWPTS